MTPHEAEDVLHTALALQEVKQPGALWLLQSHGVADPSPALVAIITQGLHAAAQSRRYHERRMMKIAEVDPTWFARRGWEVARTPAQIRAEATRAAAYKRKVAAKEEERDAWAEEHVHKPFRRQMAKMQAAFEFYDKWALPSGTHLGDATREELDEAAAVERKQAAGHEKNAEFYSRMAERVPPGGTVREHISLQDAHAVREAIYCAAPAQALAVAA